MGNKNLASIYDVIIIGAGAAGMMCAIEAGKRGRKVMLVEHATKAGEKIRISGGGRCNFTNLECKPDRFISNNRHFMKSALSRYTQHDFIRLVEQYGISWYEKKLGQLFTENGSQLIIDMLLGEMKKVGVELRLQTSVSKLSKSEDGFELTLDEVNKKREPIGETSKVSAGSVVIASGGKSIPKMGATGFGYKVAEQFDLNIVEPRPGLVPLTFHPELKDKMAALAGISADIKVKTGNTEFSEALLFTHRGLSGPAILQISSYWKEGQPIHVSFGDFHDRFVEESKSHPKNKPLGLLTPSFSQRLVDFFEKETRGVLRSNYAELGPAHLKELADFLSNWEIKPTGTEGYRTAEVTVGGVDTGELSSKTMEASKVQGLYFIGEAVDVTGWLGGYNFQWAWSSGWAAGQVV